MKIGKDTCSLVNFALANPNFVQPKVGMDVTQLMWSDRAAWRVVEVDKDGKGATLQRYAAKAVGHWLDQNYEFENEQGEPRLRDDYTMHVRYRYKAWKEDNGSTVHLRFGHREEYRDPSF